MPHTDGTILARKLGLGPIGSARPKELSMPSHNQAGNLTEVMRVTPLARLKTGTQAGTTAPVVVNDPLPTATGASSYVFPHKDDY